MCGCARRRRPSRRRHPMRSLLVIMVLVIGLPAAAQTTAGPVIQTVTVKDDTILIAGSGFGTAPTVMVGGWSLPVLPGASDTQIRIPAPAAIRATPGSYRLTVFDPTRHIGDGFVVTIGAGAPAETVTDAGASS